MGRMKAFVCAAIAALVMVGFVGIAGASDASMEEEAYSVQVDWDDAVEWAELMDTYPNDDDVMIAVYYDEGQNVLWDQPASEPVEAAAEVFPLGAEKAGALLFTQRVVPTSLWLCDNDEDDDTNCTSGTNYKWGSDEIGLDYVDGVHAYYFASEANGNPCSIDSIERIRSTGSSSTTDYCDGYYRGKYYDQNAPGFTDADDYWCLAILGIYTYGLDESDQVDDYEYDLYGDEDAAQFKYRVGLAYYYSNLKILNCLTK